jgi:hypothetical protein
MDKETWQSKAIAFVVEEREKLVSYGRRLIDDAADRDGEDLVFTARFTLISLTWCASGGV